MGYVGCVCRRMRCPEGGSCENDRILIMSIKWMDMNGYVDGGLDIL